MSYLRTRRVECVYGYSDLTETSKQPQNSHLQLSFGEEVENDNLKSELMKKLFPNLEENTELNLSQTLFYSISIETASSKDE